jgi:hypothetical protein
LGARCLESMGQSLVMQGHLDVSELWQRSLCLLEDRGGSARI